MVSPVNRARYDVILALPGLDGSVFKKSAEVPKRMIAILSDDREFAKLFPNVRHRSVILPESPFHVPGKGVFSLVKLLRLFKESANPHSKLVVETTRQIESALKRLGYEGRERIKVLAIGVSAAGQLAASLATLNANNPRFDIAGIVTFGSPFIKGVLERVPHSTQVFIHNSIGDRMVRLSKTAGRLMGLKIEQNPNQLSDRKNVHEITNYTHRTKHMNMFSWKNDFRNTVFLPVMRQMVRTGQTTLMPVIDSHQNQAAYLSFGF